MPPCMACTKHRSPVSVHMDIFHCCAINACTGESLELKGVGGASAVGPVGGGGGVSWGKALTVASPSGPASAVTRAHVAPTSRMMCSASIIGVVHSMLNTGGARNRAHVSRASSPSTLDNVDMLYQKMRKHSLHSNTGRPSMHATTKALRRKTLRSRCSIDNATITPR